MQGIEAWDFLEPTLKLHGIELMQGEPGGWITTPGFPDAGTGRTLGDNVRHAVDALAASGITLGQLELVRDVLNSVAKTVKYHTVPRYRYDIDGLTQMFRDWPGSVE